MTMPGHDPALPVAETTSTPSARNLWLRVASAAVLAPLAIVAAYFGDWPFTIFWALAAVAVWWEWVGLVQPAGRYVVLATGAAVLALEALLFEIGTLSVVVMMIALGMLAAIVTAGRHALLVAGGMIYASALVIAPAVLRADAKLGFAAILFLFAVVWGTDIAGYFAGRAFGGPKLAPSISPKKTWSGAIGGTIVAIAAALAIAHLFSIRNPAGDRTDRACAVDRLAGGRPVRIAAEARIRRQGCERPDPGPWRRHGPARRLYFRVGGGGADRGRARRARIAGHRPAGLVTA